MRSVARSFFPAARRAVFRRGTAPCVARNMSAQLQQRRAFSDGSGKLWGGRFAKDTDARVRDWAESLTCDAEMIKEDLWGSMAHVSMLGHQNIVPPTEAAAIVGQLKKLHDIEAAGEMDFFDPKFANNDDVHMNMESRVIDAIGMEVGGKMHTTRSRNDQVPVSSKLRTRNRLLELRELVVDAADAFVARAREPGALEDVMPGYTHFQHAQPISVAFWWSHYAEHLSRDLRRLKASYDITDENPLGAGAISGTSFPTDRSITTDLLGFQALQTHALDATGARDFMLDVLANNATLQCLWSRLSEELIMWSSYEFRTVTLDDGYAMGSSMMPQKKNPGPLELLRGRAGIMNGYMVGGYTMLHGLPSGYNRDFHEEKELLFASLTMAIRAAEVIPGLIETTTLNKARMEELCDKNFMNATELANYLVAEHDVPFRETHHIVGSLVGDLVKQGKDLTATDAVMAHLKSNGIEANEQKVRTVLSPREVMKTYNSTGGTGPKAVEAMLDELQAKLDGQRQTIKADQNRVTTAYEATLAIADACQAGEVTDQASLQQLVARYRPKQ